MRSGPGSGCPRAVFMVPQAPRTPPPISEAANPPRPTVVMNSRRPRPTCSVDMGVLPVRFISALPAAQQLPDDHQGERGGDDEGGDGVELLAHHRAQRGPDRDWRRVVVA